MVEVTCVPIGVVVGGRAEVVDDDWATVESIIRLDPTRYTAEALAGLDAVSHLDVAVRGLDAVTGTPVLDIKLYLREFRPRGPVRQPHWATELMARYY